MKKSPKEKMINHGLYQENYLSKLASTKNIQSIKLYIACLPFVVTVHELTSKNV
jgi:hypothetical protein